MICDRSRAEFRPVSVAIMRIGCGEGWGDYGRGSGGPVGRAGQTGPLGRAGSGAADVVLDLALAEDFKTEFRWRTENPDWRDAVKAAQLDPRMIIGTSDGGAHLAKDDGADWSSYFLRSWVLDRKVWSLEEGIRQITQVPAPTLEDAMQGKIPGAVIQQNNGGAPGGGI